MYLNAILPKNTIDTIKKDIFDTNFDLNLSSRFFNYPLHISLKRTFYTEDYELIKQDFIKLLDQYKTISIDKLYPIVSKDMLWLKVENTKPLLDIHLKLDDLLYKKYQIPIDEFDRNYLPHITLFKEENLDKLNTLYERVKDYSISNIKIDKYASGIVSRINEFYKTEGD